MVAEVVTLPTHAPKDIPTTLREIADQIENGDFGVVDSCVMVAVAEEDLDVCLMGKANSIGDAHIILHAGMLRLADTV